MIFALLNWIDDGIDSGLSLLECIYTDKLISEIGNQLLYLIDATNKGQNEIRQGRAKQWEGKRKKM